MRGKNKKLIKLESELKIYNKIAIKLAKVLDDKLSIEELDDHIFLKIRKIEEKICSLDLVGKTKKNKDFAFTVLTFPNYKIRDEVFYEGVKCVVMAVNHKNRTYDLKSPTKRLQVNWNSLFLNKDS